MIRIAVCDDEVIFVRCLRDMVEALFEKQGMEFQCFVYTSAPELIRAHRKEEFQLLFLDIDMPEMSGMELAAEIRAMNSAAALIFVSSHSDFVFESFQFQPFRFLRKEWLAEELPDAVKAYCENYAKSGQTARLVLDDKRIVTKKLVEVVYFFSIRLQWLPVITTKNLGKSIVLPAMTLVLSMASKYTRQIRAAVLEELERIKAGNGVDGELLDTIRLIAAIMDGMRED